MMQIRSGFELFDTMNAETLFFQCDLCRHFPISRKIKYSDEMTTQP